MSNHTPGPWKLETAPGGVNDGWQISSENTSRGKGRYVILASRGPITGEEFAGNARLMVAAPEMKDRLKEAKECLIYLTPWWEDDLERIEGVIDSINALLRRIEGNDSE